MVCVFIAVLFLLAKSPCQQGRHGGDVQHFNNATLTRPRVIQYRSNTRACWNCDTYDDYVSSENSPIKEQGVRKCGRLVLYVNEAMKKTCQYCGIVDENHVCPHRKRKYAKYQKDNQKDRFRSSSAWQKKRTAIKQRDHYLCQVCVTGEYDTFNQFTYSDLEVHHIEPIDSDFDRRFDDDNLITLCDYHHKMADKGIIPKKFLRGLIPS